MPADWKQIIGGAIAGFLLMGVLFTYLNASDPVLYMYFPSYISGACYPNQIRVGSPFPWRTIVQNRMETPAYSNFCFYADNVSFSYLSSKYNNSFCREGKLQPMSSGLVNEHEVLLLLNESEPDDLYIKMTSSCSYKVLSLIPKKCDNKVSICKYQKEGRIYKYVK